ncbi:MAG TPA: hypothetical protein VER08_07860 [Pyrinomonadaceae bacterium]|nr:hypothetical protein [Pyrinomonadaceae bacterium]
MNTPRPNTRARAFAVWAALAVLVLCVAAQLARRVAGQASADPTAARPGLVLHARGVVSFGRYELNLAFDSEGYPLCVSLTSADEG